MKKGSPHLHCSVRVDFIFQSRPLTPHFAKATMFRACILRPCIKAIALPIHLSPYALGPVADRESRPPHRVPRRCMSRCVKRPGVSSHGDVGHRPLETVKTTLNRRSHVMGHVRVTNHHGDEKPAPEDLPRVRWEDEEERVGCDVSGWREENCICHRFTRGRPKGDRRGVAKGRDHLPRRTHRNGGPRISVRN